MPRYIMMALLTAATPTIVNMGQVASGTWKPRKQTVRAPRPAIAGEGGLCGVTPAAAAAVRRVLSACGACSSSRDHTPSDAATVSPDSCACDRAVDADLLAQVDTTSYLTSFV